MSSSAPRPGGIYRLNALLLELVGTIGEGLGDAYNFGTCCVKALTIADVDRNGKFELLASMSQIQPRGRPRLYLWSLEGSSLLQSVARPAIASSWSHGLGLLECPGPEPASLFITFCGNGEVVEYHPAVAGATSSGFVDDALGWKKVGQLPASDEWTQTADVDNDGRTAVCLATWFGLGKAAILAQASEAPGAELRLVHRIDEGGRFDNVRFLIAPTRGDLVQDLVAWWCTDLGGGECEVVRSRWSGTVSALRACASGPSWPKAMPINFGPRTARRSSGTWTATAARSSGSRPRPAISGGSTRRKPASLARILRIDGGLGPIAGATLPRAAGSRPCLYLGRGRAVLRLKKT